MKTSFVALIALLLLGSFTHLFTQRVQEQLEAPANAAQDVVIAALSNDTSVPNVCIIFLQGALIEAQYYVEPLTQIQAQLKDSYPVWIGIPQFAGSLVNPLQIDAGFKAVQEKLFALGMPHDVNYFLAGHSLGGAQVALYSLENPIFKGNMLWGATLMGDLKNNVTIPTLQLGGELDGLTPIMRMVSVSSEHTSSNLIANAPNNRERNTRLGEDRFFLFPVVCAKMGVHLK